jgi:integrase
MSELLRRARTRNYLERAQLPQIRFHDLRHTSATVLLGKGIHPKIVQRLLGHSTIAITLETYSHIMPGMGGAAAAAIEEALGWIHREFLPTLVYGWCHRASVISTGLLFCL